MTASPVRGATGSKSSRPGRGRRADAVGPLHGSIPSGACPPAAVDGSDSPPSQRHGQPGGGPGVLFPLRAGRRAAAPRRGPRHADDATAAIRVGYGVSASVCARRRARSAIGWGTASRLAKSTSAGSAANARVRLYLEHVRRIRRATLSSSPPAMRAAVRPARTTEPCVFAWDMAHERREYAPRSIRAICDGQEGSGKAARRTTTAPAAGIPG